MSLRQFFSEPLNPDNEYFREDIEGNRVIITLMREYRNTKGACLRITWIRKGVLSTDSTIKIRQVKTCDSNIFTGVATLGIFGIKDSFLQRESITYYSGGGNLWQEGAYRKEGR